MKFNAIVGNPPYQVAQGSEKCDTNSAMAGAIYHNFLEIARRLNPSFVSMITPSRWMTKNARGVPDDWINKMLHCNHFLLMHDYTDASECFTGVEIKGGVNYFLLSSDYTGPCHYVLHNAEGVNSIHTVLDSFGAGIVIRDLKAVDILNRVKEIEGEDYYKTHSFASIVGASKMFTDCAKGILTSNWRGYVSEPKDNYIIKYYLNKNLESKGYGWIRFSDIPRNSEASKTHKVYVPQVGGSGNDQIILGRPFYGEPGSVCSETYICIGSNSAFNKEECENIISYMRTKFFRYLVSIKKKTHHAEMQVYEFVPLQDFSISWNDAELYKKYRLNKKEIDLIESRIRPMEGEVLFTNDDLIDPEFGNFSLLECGVKIGDTIVYTPTEMELTVVGNNEVEYGGEKYTLSQFTAKFLPRNKRSISGVCQGPKYLSYNGVTLYQLKESFLGGKK